MAKKKKVRRRRSGGGGGRWGINFNEAAIAGFSRWIGSQVKSLIGDKLPAQLAGASVESLGLFSAGVLFKNKSMRSIGAGLFVGEAIGLATT